MSASDFSGLRFGDTRVRALLVATAVAAGVIIWVALRGSATPVFSEFEAGPERKTAFFEFMRPLVEAENTAVLEDRERLMKIAAKGEPGWLDRRWLARLADNYGIDDTDEQVLAEQLLVRVDAVPVSLALAQAAKESGWGTSRFAREGNNFYGQWCFVEGCGIVPQSRAAGRTHEVESFSSANESVASYIRNLNTHQSYRDLRAERARLRAAGRPVSGIDLAKHLSHYSERREAYVNEVRQLILGNNLDKPEDDSA